MKNKKDKFKNFPLFKAAIELMGLTFLMAIMFAIVAICLYSLNFQVTDDYSRVQAIAIALISILISILDAIFLRKTLYNILSMNVTKKDYMAQFVRIPSRSISITAPIDVYLEIYVLTQRYHNNEASESEFAIAADGVLTNFVNKLDASDTRIFVEEMNGRNNGSNKPKN